MAKKIVLDFAGQLEKKMKVVGRDITYADIRADTKLSPATISRLYRGQFGRLKLLETLCDYFDCTPGDLLRIETQKESAIRRLQEERQKLANKKKGV